MDRNFREHGKLISVNEKTVNIFCKSAANEAFSIWLITKAHSTRFNYVNDYEINQFQKHITNRTEI